jgi:hypothetical protein
MSLLVPEMAALFRWIRRRFIGIIVGLGSILVSSESAGYIFHWMHSAWDARGIRSAGLDDVYKWHSTTGHSGCLYWGEHCPSACKASISSILWFGLIHGAIGCRSISGAQWIVLCVSALVCGILFVSRALIGILCFVTKLQTGLPDYLMFVTKMQTGLPEYRMFGD